MLGVPGQFEQAAGQCRASGLVVPGLGQAARMDHQAGASRLVEPVGATLQVVERFAVDVLVRRTEVNASGADRPTTPASVGAVDRQPMVGRRPSHPTRIGEPAPIRQDFQQVDAEPGRQRQLGVQVALRVAVNHHGAKGSFGHVGSPIRPAATDGPPGG